jgi:polyferredoxin
MFKKQVSTKTLLITAFVCISVSLLLITVPYLVFPQFYTPKSNPVGGYTMPNTLGGWIVLIVALLLLVFGIILVVICVLRPQKEFRLPHVNMGPRY